MDWKIEDGKLNKEFEFANFAEAMDFVNKLADLAEANDHHPDILIHSYRKVKIRLFTHSSSSLTELDYKLAGLIDGILI